MKRLLVCLATTLMIFSLGACTKKVETLPETTPSPEAQAPNVDAPVAIDNSKAKISMQVQEYNEKNIVEIPRFDYNMDTEGKLTNPELDMINEEIANSLKVTYESFDMSNKDQWLEILSYPFTSTDYLQVVVTTNTYPTYGTQGSMLSFNFDKVNNKFVRLTDVFAELGTNEKAIAEEVSAILTIPDTTPDKYEVLAINPVGFIYAENGVQFLLEIDVNFLEADASKNFYLYTPTDNTLVALDQEFLFDGKTVDKMNPKLKCQQ